MAEPDTFYAKLSFFLSLGFIMPLLNIPLSIISLVFGIMALRLIHLEPKRYAGRTFAVIGIVISALVILLGIIGSLIYYKPLLLTLLDKI